MFAFNFAVLFSNVCLFFNSGPKFKNIYRGLIEFLRNFSNLYGKLGTGKDQDLLDLKFPGISQRIFLKFLENDFRMVS